MEVEKIFLPQKIFRARALFLAERIDVKTLHYQRPLSVFPLSTQVGQDGLAIIYRYGSVVFFNVSEKAENHFLQTLVHALVRPLPSPIIEDIQFSLDPEKEEREIKGVYTINNISLPSLMVFSEVLSKSVVLEYYELSLSKTFDEVEPLAVRMDRGHFGFLKNKVLLGHISKALLIQHKMVGRVEVLERPDILWNYPELDRFYNKLVDSYEIEERHRALERKIALISRTAETLLGLLNHGQSMRMEWYIVFLIVFDIVLSIYDKIIKSS